MWLLLLEDEPAFGRSLSRTLNRVTGREIRVAQSVRDLDFIIATTPNPPRAIILDLDLGSGPDGAEALRRLRHIGCQSTVAFFTSASAERVESRLAAVGLEERPPYFAKNEGTGKLAAWIGR